MSEDDQKKPTRRQYVGCLVMLVVFVVVLFIVVEVIEEQLGLR